MRGLILVLMSNVLLGRNFDFLSGYLVVNARYWWLLLVTSCYYEGIKFHISHAVCLILKVVFEMIFKTCGSLCWSIGE